MKNNNFRFLNRSFFIAGSIFLPTLLSAQQTTQRSDSYFSNPLFNTLFAVIIVLAIMVLALSGALKNIIGSDLFLEKIKKNKDQKGVSNQKTLGIFILTLLLNFTAFSQEQIIHNVKDDLIGGIDQFTFYTLVSIIAIELLVLGVLFNTFINILGANAPTIKTVGENKPKTKTILDKLNDTVDLEEEASIMLDHDYDGIKELDNNLPPWWKYGFYLTILIAVIYLINYHVIKTAPLQAQEYTNSIKKAEAEIAEFMKNSANNVDESNVKVLTDVSDLNSGKDIFISTCAACHGKLGEGTVGPNLTDDYWIHGGGMKDIFKTIKYGLPDKGMKSWKEDFSPIQIAQLASYIRTLKGTNPPKPKDKQGELYIEQNIASDSTSVAVDSTKTPVTVPKK